MSTDELFKHRLWMCAIWSWPVCLVVFAIGFIAIAGFVPPPREHWSAQEIANFFAADQTGIRAGILIAMFASALLLPFYTVISAEMRKIEGRLALLAPIQFGGAVVLVVFFQLICLMWLMATLRPDVDPQIVRATNDFCWLVWSTLIPTYVVQYVCIALAGFMDSRPRPAWPRWAAYFNLWVAVTGAGGGLAVFFKTGPFAWHGVIGFWIPVILFAIGNCVNAVLLHRRAKHEAGLAGLSTRDHVGDVAAPVAARG